MSRDAHTALLEAVYAVCATSGLKKKYWLAYSGGLDSHVLLSLCHELSKSFSLQFSVLHINHNISPNANAWAKHCAKVCAQYDLHYIEHLIQIDQQAGSSFEEAARIARYHIFSHYLNADDVLLTAHHQDDQAETILLQLLRGAGPKGLAGMPVLKPFAKGWHARPLLSFSRAALKAYATQQQLNWIEDESNDNQQFTRNFIRHSVLPLLKTRWPTVEATLSRSALHCGETQTLLEKLATKEQIIFQGSRANTLSVTKLLSVDNAQQKWLLRAWMQQSGHPMPNARKMAAIQENILTAQWDRLPCVKWGESELRRYRDDLYLMSALPPIPDMPPLSWKVQQPIVLAQQGILKIQPVENRGLRVDIHEVQVAFRRGGEKIQLAHRGTHTLKNLFHEWNVLPWERDRIPLIYFADKLIAVVGYYLDDAYSAREKETGHELIWIRH